MYLVHDCRCLGHALYREPTRYTAITACSLKFCVIYTHLVSVEVCLRSCIIPEYCSECSRNGTNFSSSATCTSGRPVLTGVCNVCAYGSLKHESSFWINVTTENVDVLFHCCKIVIKLNTRTCVFIYTIVIFVVCIVLRYLHILYKHII
jgi:hypothetical protein